MSSQHPAPLPPMHGVEASIMSLLETAVGQYLSSLNLETSPPRVELQVPRKPEHGDYACNIAMQLARIARRKPMEIAESVVQQLPSSDLLEPPEVASPGFINLRLAPPAVSMMIQQALDDGESYGRTERHAGQRVLVEFVSANPTGPLHIGHGRNAVVGDTLARLYEATGYAVEREYYFNDAGVQMNLLGESLRARYLQACGEDVGVPEDGYQGEYMIDLGRALFDEAGASRKSETELEFFTDYASKAIMALIRKDLEKLGIVFDTYFSETSLHRDGRVEEALRELQKLDRVYEKDEALWLRTADFGDDKDRVIRKSDGAYTYLMPDIAYHADKYSRGFDRLVNVLGGDHHGYVARLRAAVAALGHDPQSLHFVLIQMVGVKEGGKSKKLSTRAGDFDPLAGILDELGPDVVRFFFLMRAADSQLTFDLDIARQKTMDNPYWYIQYAHARCCSLMSKGEESGAGWRPDEPANLDRLSAPEERGIVLQIARLPAVVLEVVNKDEPLPMTTYLRELATAFHSYFTAGNNDASLRVIQTDDSELTQARLTLIAALRTTLANGLRLLGMTPIERL